MRDPLPDGLDVAGFSYRDGRESGLTPAVLRGTALSRPFHGIRTSDDPTTLLARATAFAPLLRPWQCIGGVSALPLLGLPVPWRLANQEVVEIVSDRKRGRPEREGVVVRRLPADLIGARVGVGVPIAAPPLAWALMAGRCSVHELVMLGDAIVTDADNYPDRRFCGPLASLDDLRAITARWSGRRGAELLRRALPRIRERVESPRETDMRLHIVDAGMPEPEVQVSIYDPETGRLLGRADLLHRNARVVEEYEGKGHRSKQQWDRDIQKYRDFERIGLHVVRATNRDFVPSPDRWLADLAAVLARRAP